MIQKKKPEWLKIKIGGNNHYKNTKTIVETNNLHTICSSGKCPNIGECWGMGTATFMIAGEICTRNCKFCNTQTGKPLPLNLEEPQKVANSVKLMKLKHVVITSVDRDDLPDMGAEHWIETINAVRQTNPTTTIEVLLPDFQGKSELINKICETKPDIISHNIETVERLTPTTRSVAKYQTSLDVLKQFSQHDLQTKTGFMLGLGETEQEVIKLIDDLVNINCKILTIGQYLQPTRKHLPVVEYIHPDIFEKYKEVAIQKGFLQVESGPLVRSSYHAKPIN